MANLCRTCGVVANFVDWRESKQQSKGLLFVQPIFGARVMARAKVNHQVLKFSGGDRGVPIS